MQLKACNLRQMAISIPWLLVLVTQSYGQSIAPSNNSNDLLPAESSPRFLLNGTDLSTIPAVRIAPVEGYARMSHQNFLNVHLEGTIVNVNASNVNDIAAVDQFSYISCDPEFYTGELDASEVFWIAVNSPRVNIIILYSESSAHCVVNDINRTPEIGGILTTTDSLVASELRKLDFSSDDPGRATIVPDLNSYTNTSGNGQNYGGGPLGQSPTTAVAMIILYSITGIITALFVVIILTGAVRAHRHPERYGPRNIVGRGRQSRAKGIARAMLDTIPIVKFGDRQETPKPGEDPSVDVEMSAGERQLETEPSSTKDGTEVKTSSAPTPAAAMAPADQSSQISEAAAKEVAVDLSAANNLACSICTEDFERGEEVRVLPCNHSFHPDCVDPWLLNVSGTCPLCRIDLRPRDEDGNIIEEEPSASRRGSAAGADAVEDRGGYGEGRAPPPLRTAFVLPGTFIGSPTRAQRETLDLRSMIHRSRDERIAALRRLREQRRGDRAAEDTVAQGDEEPRGLAARLRERFRIHTERRGTVAETPQAESPTLEQGQRHPSHPGNNRDQGAA